MSLMKGQGEITAREVNEMEISNIPDREFQVMVMELLTGLEERMEDLSETNKEMEN